MRQRDVTGGSRASRRDGRPRVGPDGKYFPITTFLRLIAHTGLTFLFLQLGRRESEKRAVGVRGGRVCGRRVGRWLFKRYVASTGKCYGRSATKLRVSQIPP